MSAEIRALLDRYVEAYNAADWEAIAQVVAPDYVHHSGEQVYDLAGFVAGARWFRNGLPDLRVQPVDVLVDGDRAAVRFQVRGRHTGSFSGEEPSGREVTLDGITVYRVVDDRIVEDWEAMDEGQLGRQLPRS